MYKITIFFRFSFANTLETERNIITLKIKTIISRKEIFLLPKMITIETPGKK